MRRRVGLLALLTLLSLLWADWGGPGDAQVTPLRVQAEPLPNPGLIALRYQTGPLDTGTVTPTPPIGIILPIQTPLPTPRQGGLPPTIPPVVGTRGAVPIAPIVTPGEGGLPVQTLLPTISPRTTALPGVTVTPLAGQPTPGATSAAGGGRVAPTATLPLAGVRTFSGRIVQKDDTSIVVRVPNQGELTVSPGDDTEIRRDNVAATLAMLSIGDQATVVLGPNDELLRILVTTRPATPEPSADEGGVNVLTVIWQALLGLVMMGLVLIFDSELRTKFLAALLEPSGSYPYGRR